MSKSRVGTSLLTSKMARMSPFAGGKTRHLFPGEAGKRRHPVYDQTSLAVLNKNSASHVEAFNIRTQNRIFVH